MTLYLWSCSRGIEGPNPSSSTSEFSANQVFCKSVAQFTRRAGWRKAYSSVRLLDACYSGAAASDGSNIALQKPLSQSGIALELLRQYDKDPVGFRGPGSRDFRRSPATLDTSGCAGPPAAWQVNLNKRTPELERAHLAIRHPPAGRQRVRPAQLTLSDPLHGEQPTADRVVSAE
jgi:hypothetical protein